MTDGVEGENLEKHAGKPGAIKSSLWRRFLFICGVAAVLVVLAIASIPLLSPRGWSKDVVFDDGRMGMRVQFKTSQDARTSGTQNLFV